MARMYPKKLAPDINSRAEIELYNLFSARLSDEYHVFHGVAWQARTGQYGARDGEADFIILHPDCGILVMEVKSGVIAYDGISGAWRQNSHEMKNPFEQAKSSRYHLQRTLQENSYWRGKDIVLGHAVAFPHVVTLNTPLTLQAPQTIIFDQRNLQDPASWFNKAFAYYQGETHRDVIDSYGLNYLIDMLAPVRELKSLMSLDFQAESMALVELTGAQYRVLDTLAWQARAAVAGCAGSGKTMLAAEKARRLAAQGWRVLLTCFNRNLADFLREDYLLERPSSLDIFHFHKLALDIVKRSGQLTHKYGRLQYEEEKFFKYELPDMLATAAEQLGAHYDAIIVDEGQDFLPEWWLPLQMLLRDPDNGTFYIFYDDNQNIYGGVRENSGLTLTFPLVENCRNTRKIHEMVQQFYQADHTIISRGPSGRAVQLLPYTDKHTLVKALGATLHELVSQEQVDPADIVILSPKSAAKSELSRIQKVGNFQLTTNWDIDNNEVFYTTIHSFKGLESPVIILVEIGEPGSLISDELLYVGFSRARNHLVIICHHQWASQFSKSLKQSAV